ncbi:MATE family efflux transporter [Apibacter raozihei]|uniref:MATE family efflux transporter n=1 Tax=Apibacter raozihei TaxID=2500547 RepID=UPI000FE387E5|nr:MATE family efflux transporter [Apibacter raozihei]
MNRSILRLAIPNIISNLSVPLLGMVDMFIAGHLTDENYIGAIAIASIIFNFIYWGFSFLRMGTSGFAAQAYGKQNRNEQTEVLIRSLYLALLAGIIIIALQGMIALVSFYLLNVDENIKIRTKQYFDIYIWSAPAVLILFSLNGWFIGMQNSKIPMVITIAINSLNILLSFLFVYQWKLEIRGIAYASLIAQYTGMVTYLLICKFRYKHWLENISLKKISSISSFIPFLKVNRDIFIRTLALLSVSSFFMYASSKQGNLILSANALLMQMFVLFSYIMDGFAYAAESLTGKFVGANKFTSLKQLINKLLIWSFTIAIIFTLLYTFSLTHLLSFFTDKASLLEICYQYRWCVICIPLAGFLAFVWDGIFVEATASRQMRNSMLISVSIFFVCYYGLDKYQNNHTLWFSFLLYLLSRGLIQSYIAKRFLFVL